MFQKNCCLDLRGEIEERDHSGDMDVNGRDTVIQN